jgi:thymidylate kinase
VKRFLQEAKSAFRMTNLIAEEWFRQLVVWRYRLGGLVVLCDRHLFAEYYASDVLGQGPERTLARRLHGFLLAHSYPKPHLVICFDAPAEILFARKGEGTVEVLEERRRMYLDMRTAVGSFATADASRPVDEVVEEVKGIITDFLATRTGRLASERR